MLTILKQIVFTYVSMAVDVMSGMNWPIGNSPVLDFIDLSMRWAMGIIMLAIPLTAILYVVVNAIYFVWQIIIEKVEERKGKSKWIEI